MITATIANPRHDLEHSYHTYSPITITGISVQRLSTLVTNYFASSIDPATASPPTEFHHAESDHLQKLITLRFQQALHRELPSLDYLIIL